MGLILPIQYCHIAVREKSGSFLADIFMGHAQTFVVPPRTQVVHRWNAIYNKYTESMNSRLIKVLKQVKVVYNY